MFNIIIITNKKEEDHPYYVLMAVQDKSGVCGNANPCWPTASHWWYRNDGGNYYNYLSHPPVHIIIIIIGPSP